MITNFTIRNNLIMTDKSMSAVFSLEPIDLIILPEQEQKIFELDMQRMLNSIQEGKIQIIMRTRKAVPSDLDRHFASFSGTISERARLILAYTDQLIELLDQHIIPVKEYFLVFVSSVNTKKTNKLPAQIELLERTVNRIAANFSHAGIVLNQVTGKNLITLAKTFTRL